jgi:hypothetical protein
VSEGIINGAPFNSEVTNPVTIRHATANRKGLAANRAYFIGNPFSITGNRIAQEILLETQEIHRVHGRRSVKILSLLTKVRKFADPQIRSLARQLLFHALRFPLEPLSPDIHSRSQCSAAEYRPIYNPFQPRLPLKPDWPFD